MRTKTPQQSEKVLDAAARLFGGQRFHEVRMDDIAAEAKVGKGTLYRYFADKEQLFEALLARASERFQRQVDEALAATTGTRARLIALVTAVIAFFDEQPHLRQIIQRVEAIRGAASPWQPARDVVIGRVVELIRAAHKAREFRMRDAEHSARMLLGGLRSIVFFGKRPRPRGLAATIVNEFLTGSAHPTKS